MHLKFIPALLLSFALIGGPSSLQAQTSPKIAIVDMKKVFEGYFKTKQADGQLKERRADADKVLKGMLDDYQKANEEYKKFVEGANDQAVSTEEREKRKKNAETKLVELREIETNVQQFRRETAARLDETQRRYRDNIIREIREVVSTKAKAGGYNFVFDSSADSAALTPIILYTSGQTDLSDEVLAQLNLDAPKTETPPAAEKDEKK
ncbi:MAG: OmpH family outer membrane protein [Verrucomicrobiota bacterium]|jgi:outer membrane protein